MRELIALQVMMFLLIASGILMKKTGIIGEEGKKNLTDLVIYLILPANILKSFMIEFSWEILEKFIVILIISTLIQIGCVFIGKIVYGREEENKRKSLQYGIICSNAGFLGNPLAEGVFGSFGLALASIYLIPLRIMMWSAGIAIFSGESDKKKTLIKVCTHPCIITCVIGFILMIGRIRLPLELTKAITSLSDCNTALSMLVIGTLLADTDIKSMWDKKVFMYCFWRLIFIPGVVFVLCMIAKVDSVVMGVSVLLAGMPAGATTSILASKYNSDAQFATRMVMVSTVLSLFTTAIWCFII